MPLIPARFRKPSLEEQKREALRKDVAALATTMKAMQGIGAGTTGASAGAMGPVMPGSQFQGGWNNLGNASMAMLQRVTANMARQHNVPVADIEQQLIEQGLTWGPPFPPGRPLDPFFGWRRQPRTWDYTVGENVQLTPRWNRVSFETLKAIYDAYDVAQICVSHNINDVRSLDFDWVPLPGERDDVSGDIEQARAFFEYPDKKQPFRAWLAEYMQDVLRYDAGTLYVQRTNAGAPYALEVVNGATMIPLIDFYGRIAADRNEAAIPEDGTWPGGDTPGFLQIIEGMPWVWLTTDDIIYQPLWPLPESQYGQSPLERILISANTDIRFQQHFLEYFTAGSLPSGFMQAPEDLSDPAQVAELQETWDALMVGDQQMLRRIRFVPHGSEFTAVKNADFDESFPLYLMRRVAAAYGITPANLGFTECYDEQTECLTDSGWKRYDELQPEDLVADFDPETKRIEFVQPTHYYCERYAGDMIRFKSRSVDVCVTPGHRMWAWKQTQDRTPERRPWREYRADALEHSSRFGFVGSLTFDAPEIGTFLLPGVERNRNGWRDAATGRIASPEADGAVLVEVKPWVIDDRLISMDDWLEFLGYFVSEGMLSNPVKRSGGVSLSQSRTANPEKVERLDALLGRLPISWTVFDTADGCRNWAVTDKALWTWLKDNVGVGSRGKRLPDLFRSLGQRQAKILLDALIEGDGSRDRRYGRDTAEYGTMSAQLADDVQELAMRLGYRANNRGANRIGFWRVAITEGRDHQMFYEHVSRESYDGMVWCLEVPHHLFVTRRNGKVTVQGNTVNRATSDTQVDIQWRVGTLPLVRHVEDVINLFVRQHLGLRCRLQFDKGQEIEDRLMSAQADQLRIDSGVISVDEARAELGYPIDRSRPIPRYIMTKAGPVPLLALESMAGKIDEETYAPDKSQELIPNPYIGMPGVLPVQGSPEQKAMAGSDAQMQRDLLSATTGQQPTAEMQAAIAAANPPPAGSSQGPAGTTAQPAETPPMEGAGSRPEPAGAKEPASKEGLGGGGNLSGVFSATSGIQGDPLASGSPVEDDEDEDDETSELYGFNEEWKAAKSLDALIDLRRWRENARNRIRKGQSPRQFRSTAIPPEVQGYIWARLEKASSRREVNQVFADVLAGRPFRYEPRSRIGSPR